MTEQHYTVDEIRMKMRHAEPTMDQWRQRFTKLYVDTLVPTIMWRLQCLELMQRAQLQLTYTRHQTLNCSGCNRTRPQKGSGIRYVLGRRRRVCKACVKSIDRAKKQ